MSAKCPNCESIEYKIFWRGLIWDEHECLGCGFHYVYRVGLNYVPHCQNCNQPMNQLPDDQIGEGWEYWHCERCHGGEPFKAGHYDRPA